MFLMHNRHNFISLHNQKEGPPTPSVSIFNITLHIFTRKSTKLVEVHLEKKKYIHIVKFKYTKGSYTPVRGEIIEDFKRRWQVHFE